jgi:uncharacterized membrane protein YvlD (DUF360 family)
LIINAFIFVLADYLLPFLSVNNFAYALLGSVLLMTINICLTGLLNLKPPLFFLRWFYPVAHGTGQEE